MQQGGGSDMMTWNRGMYDSTNNIMVMSNSVGGSTSHLLTAMQLAPVPVPAIVGSGIKRGFSSVYGSGNEAEAENGTGLAFKKKRLSSEQVKVLESSFEVENKLEAEKKAELAKELGLQPRQVAVWFQNRRARSKTKRLEFSFDSLRDHYDAVLEERDRLRTEVAHLTAMLAQVKDGNQHDTEENNNDTFPVEQKANLEQNSNLMVGFIGEKGSPGTSDYSHISDPAASIQRPISSSSPCHCDSSPPKLNQLPTTLPTAAARGAGDEELDFADEPFANLFPITGDVQNEMMMWLW